MINLRKAKIYRKYDGDYDALLNAGTSDERSALEEGDWSLMASIVFDLETQKLVAQKNAKPPEPRKGTYTLEGRTYTPMTETEAKEANAFAERFNGLIKESEYEAVLGELYGLA